MGESFINDRITALVEITGLPGELLSLPDSYKHYFNKSFEQELVNSSCNDLAMKSINKPSFMLLSKTLANCESVNFNNYKTIKLTDEKNPSIEVYLYVYKEE